MRRILVTENEYDSIVTERKKILSQRKNYRDRLAAMSMYLGYKKYLSKFKLESSFSVFCDYLNIAFQTKRDNEAKKYYALIGRIDKLLWESN
jgi:hypothetical protein